jgi:hypothetical protein
MKLAAAVAFTASLLAACGGRAHLEPAFGRSTWGQFAIQRARPAETAPTRAAPGLDAQEASIISTSYRQSLSPREAQLPSRPDPILVVAPRQPGSAPALPPSVPRE